MNDKGLSLVELIVSIAILSVGSLAVFTVFFQLHQLGLALENQYDQQEKDLAQRANSLYLHRTQPYLCEAAHGVSSWRDN